MFDLFDLIAGAMNDTAKLLTTILYCIPVLLAAALYVLQGIALTYLCKASRAGSVWMAWVPFANQYLLGKQADVYTEDRILRGEVSSEYAPSTLRRKMLGFSIVESERTKGEIFISPDIAICDDCALSISTSP